MPSVGIKIGRRLRKRSVPLCSVLEQQSGDASLGAPIRRPGNVRRSKRASWDPDRPFIVRYRLRFSVYALLGIVAAAVVVGVIILAADIGIDDVDPAHKILELTGQDIDPETTAIEKSLLKTNQIDGPLAEALWSDARRQLSGDTLKEAQRALIEGHVSPAVEPLIKQIAADFTAGKAAAYTIWVAEDESQRGNTVDLRLNGFPLGRFPIEQNRYAITVVERTGRALQLEITGVSGSYGGAVFRAETATSEAETRHLHTGKSDTWQLVVK
jgi:hypothetical protein